MRNNNAVGTGTVTLSDALFQLGGNSNLTIANNFKIDNTPFGSFFDNNGRTLTLNGNITDGNGPGSLEFENNGGGGKFVLNGNNTYTGGTFICSCATVQLGDSTHVGSLVGAITVEGTFTIFNATTTGITSIDNQFQTTFLNSTSAANIAITDEPGSVLSFRNNSTAGNALITIAFGGNTLFYDRGTAGNAVIINNSSTGSVDPFDGLAFSSFSTAGSATIITADGAYTSFYDNSTGGNARLIANGTGVVDFSQTTGPNGDGQVTAGSIEGSGFFYIGAGNTLTVGSNNLSTTVSGVIADSCGCTPGLRLAGQDRHRHADAVRHQHLYRRDHGQRRHAGGRRLDRRYHRA